MGLSKLWGKDSSGAHGFVFSHIKAIYYNFSQNKLLSTKLDEMDAKDTVTDNKIGNLSDLTTSVKSSVVAAITEVVSDMGDLSDLDSSVKTSLVAAINEALGNAQTAQNSVGTLSSLTTTAKTSAVAAINELNSKVAGKADSSQVSSLSSQVSGLSNQVSTVNNNARLLAAGITPSEWNLLGQASNSAYYRQIWKTFDNPNFTGTPDDSQEWCILNFKQSFDAAGGRGIVIAFGYSNKTVKYRPYVNTQWTADWIDIK